MSNLNKLLGNFYLLHFEELSRFLSRRVATTDTADDLTQEVFTRLAERGEQIEDIRHPRGYLYRSAKNLVIERWRLSGEQVAGRFEEEALASDTEGSPETILQQRQTLALMMTAIEELPPRCREVFLLHRFDGLSYPQIAEQLDISVSAVEKQMMRAMKACRNALEQTGKRA